MLQAGADDAEQQSNVTKNKVDNKLNQSIHILYISRYLKFQLVLTLSSKVLT